MRKSPQGSKINSLLKGFAGKAYQATVGLIDRTTGGIRSLETKLMQFTGKAYNVTVGLKDQASRGIKNIADGALMGMGGMGLSMLGGAGIGFGAINAINVYKDYEHQMANVKALIATGDKAIDTKNMDALIAKSKELGATTKFKASEVGKTF